MDLTNDLLSQIQTAQPANEAEVETKVLLHLLRLLGYTDTDRADKPTVVMHYGRERLKKEPDFILYDGAERAVTNALLTVEAKAPGVDLFHHSEQAISYATWAGTPSLLMCNGPTIAVATCIPGTRTPAWRTFDRATLDQTLDQLRVLVGRRAAQLQKERTAFLFECLPAIGDLPASEFLREYVDRLHARFQCYAPALPLAAPPLKHATLPDIPINIRWEDFGRKSDDVGLDRLTELIGDKPLRLALHGAPGSGKSTLCRRVAHSLAGAVLARNSSLIPIFIDLSRAMPSSRSTLLEAACREIGARNFPTLFDEHLSRGRSLIILDGLDETRLAKAEAEQRLQGLIGAIGNQSVLLTSRTHALDSPREMLRTRSFRFGFIRDLSETEVQQVLSRHLNNENHLPTLLSRAASGDIPDLNKPLTALLAIRVANDLDSWAALSTFSLYESYLGVLHRYFNTPTTRGDGIVANESTVVRVHSSAAIALQTQELDAPLSIEMLQEELTERHGPDPVLAWLNCGLATSKDGRAAFIHESFLDFGLAYALVDGLRARGRDGLLVKGPTTGAYSMAASALTDHDDTTLLDALTHESARVRTRSVRLLRLRPATPAIVRSVAQLFDTEPSAKVRRGMAVIILSASEGGPEWLRSEFLRSEGRKRRILATVARASNSSEVRSFVLTVAEAGNTKFGLTSFHFAVRTEDFAIIDRLAPIYSRMSLSKRRSVCDQLDRGSPEFTGALARALVASEFSPELLVRLVSCVVRSANDGLLDQALIDHAIVSTKPAIRFGKIMMKRLEALRTALASKAMNREDIQRLLSAWQTIGRRSGPANQAGQG